MDGCNSGLVGIAKVVREGIIKTIDKINPNDIEAVKKLLIDTWPFYDHLNSTREKNSQWKKFWFPKYVKRKMSFRDISKEMWKMEIFLENKFTFSKYFQKKNSCKIFQNAEKCWKFSKYFKKSKNVLEI